MSRRMTVYEGEQLPARGGSRQDAGGPWRGGRQDAGGPCVVEVEYVVIEREDRVFMRLMLIVWLAAALGLLTACAFEWYVLAKMGASFW